MNSKNANGLLHRIGALFVVLLANFSFGQTQLYVLDFETAGGYTTSATESASGSNYFIRTDGSNITGLVSFNNIQGSYFFGAQDIDLVTPSSFQTLTISGINVVGATSLEFRVYLAEDDDGVKESYDATDYVHFDFQLDGGGYSPLLWIENDGSTFNSPPFIDTDFDGDGDGTEITDTFTQFTQSISGTGSSLDIQISFDLNSGEEDIAIDHIEIYGIPCVVSTITSFSPTSATTGQIITITGTGFGVNTTAVEIGGVAASSFTVVSATEITATVAAGASSGDVQITTSGCPTALGGFTYLTCLPQTITGFTPIEGPEGTWVTITGSDFTSGTGTDSVWMGGQPATIISTSSTELVVEVPAGMADSTITVRTNGCSVSTGQFGLIESTPCASNLASDLIISELYDANSGGLSYIELFNGTGSPVDLSTYTIRVFNNGNSSPNGLCVGSLSGTLNNGSAIVYSFGGNSLGALASEHLGNCGINDNDCVQLLKNGSAIDVVGACDGSTWPVGNASGYNYVRNSSISSPTTTFSASDWVAFDPAIADSLGSHTYNQGSSPIAITSQPVSDTVCEGEPVTFSVASSGTGQTYEWKQVTPSTNTFNAVTNGGIYSGASTTTLSLSTTTTTENQNQFFVEITSGLCILRSRAVQLTVEAKPNTSTVFHN